ncbi:hypothetical protein OPV22_002593 [Ensete ventricosum]|uniref:Uncharacterized protein n=1 Tax=Ensete ventricosum TaxID=4639 RepID=A0AAV8RYE6_ENSVE|nr:hypothetical protein OPV22_002593 [Ensete ventricosum]
MINCSLSFLPIQFPEFKRSGARARLIDPPSKTLDHLAPSSAPESPQAINNRTEADGSCCFEIDLQRLNLPSKSDFGTLLFICVLWVVCIDTLVRCHCSQALFICFCFCSSVNLNCRQKGVAFS